MKYPYKVQPVQEADGERYWVARSESLNGCIGTGNTSEEATRELEENEIAWIESALEFGIEIPPVSYDREEKYRGKFTVRLSPFEHRRAVEQANRQGLSLNQYVVNAIINYTAEERTAEYISETVSAMAQDIGKRSLSGTSYSTAGNKPSRIMAGTSVRYKQ